MIQQSVRNQAAQTQLHSLQNQQQTKTRKKKRITISVYDCTVEDVENA